MCLYNRLIKNKKFTANKKNGGIIPAVNDNRTLYVPIGCGNCIECRKQEQNKWMIRLHEDIKEFTNGKFITLTFSNESIQELSKHEKAINLKGYNLDNAIATIAVRYFTERWRKKFGKSIRHWLVTELGHQGTENIHMHGILWTDESYETIAERWSYGFIWPKPNSNIKTWVNGETIAYSVKYVSKMDKDHPNYKSKILATDGIGRSYLKNLNSKLNKFDEENTKETYTLPSGYEMSLPIYYRNKLYTDAEKEKLWIHRLNKNERWICGDMVKADDTANYLKLLKWHQKRNEELGYGDNRKDWEKIEYENKQREILMLRRLQNEHGYPASWDE